MVATTACALSKQAADKLSQKKVHRSQRASRKRALAGGEHVGQGRALGGNERKGAPNALDENAPVLGLFNGRHLVFAHFACLRVAVLLVLLLRVASQAKANKMNLYAFVDI